jgi:hypothetical protein
MAHGGRRLTNAQKRVQDSRHGRPGYFDQVPVVSKLVWMG